MLSVIPVLVGANIWNWLLAGLTWIVTAVLFPLFGGRAEAASAAGLSTLIGGNAAIVLELAYLILGTFNLKVAFICIAIALTIWVASLIYHVIKFIMLTIKMIPGL